MSSYVKHVGGKFNKWTVVDHFKNDREVMFKCICDCGNAKDVCARNVLNGRSKSCGCFKKEYAVTHGEASNRTMEYNIWSNMKSRCLNKSNRDYDKYGGRGIFICEEWVGSYETFLMDMGRSPSKKHSVDRIDNNSGYCPENCRWVMQYEQLRNTRRNVNITFNGITKTAQDWANDLNMTRSAFVKRLKNWGLERALTEKRNENFVRDKKS